MVGSISVRRVSGDVVPCRVVDGQTLDDVVLSLAKSLELPASRLRLSHERQILCGTTDAYSLAGSVVDLIIMQSKKAISGAADCTLRVWDLDALTCIGTLSGHSDVVLTVAVDFCAQRAVSGSADETLRVWDIEALTCTGTLKGHRDLVLAVSADFGVGLAMSSSMDDTLRIWDLEAAACIGLLDGDGGWITAVSADFHRKRALSGGQDALLRLWDLETLICVGCLSGHESWVSSIVADFSACRAASSSSDGSIRIWDLESMTCIGVLEGHIRTVIGVVADFGLQRALSHSASTFCMWDLSTMKCLSSRRGNDIEAPEKAVDSNMLEAVSVWEFEADLCDTFNRHASDILALATNLGEGFAISSHTDCTLRIWELATWNCLGTLEGHSGSARVVAVDPAVRGVRCL
mmetsp:Transcript_120935/g.342071  ORF Transcript_120935/g.342071 Transcript_120935/m.342071 type:complete len:406 (+) Transcript_120935:110-1327(+)